MVSLFVWKPGFPRYALPNRFSSCCRVNSIATGLPWGQYLTAPDMTASATLYSLSLIHI